jgi:predicted acyltransferase
VTESPTSLAPELRRFDSVDAFRGLTIAAMLVVNNPGDWEHVLPPLLHAPWHGATPTDFIFPFFLFIVGVSIALSVGPRREAGADAATLSRSIAWRGARLFALGLVLSLAVYLTFDRPALRLMGILQRIAVCYVIVALLAVFVRPRLQWVSLTSLLIGYWALLAMGGTLEPGTNLVSRVDTALLGSMAFEFDAASGRGHDPEGLLSTLPAIGTTLLGLWAGQWLRAGQLRRLLLAGAFCLVAALAWSPVLPFNKNLWTSSFVLWTGGWAFLALVLVHWCVDRRGAPPLGRSFGVNAIAIYASSILLVCALVGTGLGGPLYEDLLASWMTPLVGPYVASLAYALLFLALFWFLARSLDRRGIYIKI